jgi:hypothetical protein
MRFCAVGQKVRTVKTQQTNRLGKINGRRCEEELLNKAVPAASKTS